MGIHKRDKKRYKNPKVKKAETLTKMIGTFILITLVLGCTKTDIKNESDNKIPFKDEILEEVNCPDCNVILLVIDTLRADHLGVYGYPRNTSPNIDALASDGILFDNPWSQWPATGPSMSAIFTGKYVHTTGVKPRTPCKLTKDITLAEILNANELKTGAVVSNGALTPKYGFNRGYDDDGEEEDYEIANASDDYMRIGDSGDSVTQTSIDWIKKNKGNQFFMWIHYVKPHTKYVPTHPFNESFIDDRYYGTHDLKLNEEFNDDIGGISGRANLNNKTNFFYYVSQYDGEIQYVDDEVGKLIEGIESMGLKNKTLIIITSDHGETMGEHNAFFEHGWFIYESTMKVPLIISSPIGFPVKKRIKTPVQAIDIMPTILEFLNIEIPEDLEGESLYPLIFNDSVDKEQFIYTEGGREGEYIKAIRDNRWKLIHVPEGDDRRRMKGVEYELYDLQEDPMEQENLMEKRKDVFESLYGNFTWFIKKEKRPVNLDDEPVLDENDPEDRKTLKALRDLGYIE